MSLVNVEAHDCSSACVCPVGERNRLRAELDREKEIALEIAARCGALRAEVARLTTEAAEQRDRAEAAESREAALREALSSSILAAEDFLAAVPAPAPHLIEVDGTLVPVDARGHALPRVPVPAPDAAPTEAALMAVAERVRDRICSKLDLRSARHITETVDLAAIVKGEKP